MNAAAGAAAATEDLARALKPSRRDRKRLRTLRERFHLPKSVFTKRRTRGRTRSLTEALNQLPVTDRQRARRIWRFGCSRS